MVRYSGIMLTAALLAVLGSSVVGAGEVRGEPVDRSPLAAARDRLAATEDALDRTRLKYLEATGQQNLDAGEAEDFKGFIAALEGQVHNLCDEVRGLGGDLSAHAAYCARVRDAGGAPLPGPARTRAEVAAEIDGEFDAAIGEFDEMLLREQRALDRHTPKTASSGGSAGGGSAGGDAGQGSSGGGSQGSSGAGEGKAGAAGSSGRAQAANQSRGGGAGAAGDRQSVNGPPGRGGRGVATNAGADIPDGRDDDVVARQLREAAMKEQDPELRRRLWDEYKRYKQGKGGDQ